MEFNIVTCPHCLGDILIFNNEICCAIFRHGIYKHNGNQLDPHASKEECDNAYIKINVIIYKLFIQIYVIYHNRHPY
jgi:hypothetical protein